MSTFSKKFVSVALTATTAAWFSGALLLVPTASAATTAELQAQIAALLAQISQLQTQLNTSGGASASFTRDLTVGSKGADVSALQSILIAKGFLKIAAPTGFFGALTKAAVAAWQSSAGISPAAGYVGPKSRAVLNAMAGPTPTPTPTPSPNPSPNPTPTPVPAPASGLAVGLAASNPATGALISSSGAAAARVPVLATTFTAGIAGGITVNQVKFKKNGVLSDNAISGAYLVENGRILAQYSSLSGGVITFSGMNLGINAGQTRTLTLAIDPATGLSAGNTVSFSLAAGSDIMAVDSSNVAVTPAGPFPLNGNVFTVTSVSNPSIASVTIASSSVGNSVYAGTQNVLVSQWTITAANSPVNLRSINFKVIGSASKTDLKNVVLKVNGNQVGTTLAQVSADGTAFFDLSASPVKLNTGSSNVQVFADVMGSPSFTFQFELLNNYDVEAIDTQYNVPVSVTVNGGSGVQITINQGQVTLTQSSDTPTGNIAKGGSAVLAKFKLYAAGEPIQVRWLGFSLTFGSGAAPNGLDSEMKNVSLTDDAGNQVGSTVNSLATAVTCTDTAQTTATSSAVVNCFGNSTSPINYTVPANTTRILSLRGDVQTTAGAATVQAKLTGNTNNLKGQTSNQTASSGAVNGNVLTIVSTALTTAKNTGVGTVTVSAGAQNKRIGSYNLSASSAEGVNLTSITILTSASSTNFQNLRVVINNDLNNQFGVTQPTLGASASYTFSGTLNIGAGTTKTVDVYADVLQTTAANTYTGVTTLNGCSGSGATSFASVSCTARTGQDVKIAGQATVQVSASAGTAAAGQIVMGATNVPLATFLLTETSNTDDVLVKNLIVFQQVASTTTVAASFTNLTINWTDGGVAKSKSMTGSANTAASSSNPGSGYYWKFDFTGDPIKVAQNGTLSVVLKGDVSSFSASAATDNATHVFKISTSTDSENDTTQETVVAQGSTSNASSAVTLSSATGNAMTILRTTLAVAGSDYPLPKANHSRTASDDVGTITFTANSAGALLLNTVGITLSGNGTSNATSTSHTASSTAMLMDSVQLLNTDNTTFCSASLVSTSSQKAVFSLSNCNIDSSGKTAKIRISSNQVYQSATAGATQNVTFQIAAATDVSFTDAISGGNANINLPGTAVPLTLATPAWSD